MKMEESMETGLFEDIILPNLLELLTHPKGKSNSVCTCPVVSIMYTPKSGGMASSSGNIIGSGGGTERTYTSASARAVAAAAARRRSSGLFTSGVKRSPFSVSGRATPVNRSLQTSQVLEAGSGQYVVESYGSSLPALVMEALTFADRNAELSVVLSSTGWAWLVAGRRLLIWRYRADSSRRMANHQFRELTLPPSDLAHRAQLVAVFSSTEGQVPSCIAVSPEGFVRYWPNITHEGSYFEISTELQGQECDSLLFLGSSLGCLLATTTSTVLQVQPVSGSVTGGHISLRHLKVPAGILGGISRRVSSLVFGSMPTQAPEARLVGITIVESGETDERCVIVLSARALQKWYLCPGQCDKLLYECNVDKFIHEAFIDHVWGRDRVGGGQLQLWLVAVHSVSGTSSVMILTAAVNPQISQQLVYALVTLDTSGATAPQGISGFCMLKHSEYYQESAESIFLAQRFILCGNTAYIYSKNSVLCVPSTNIGESDSGDRIEFSTAADSILGAGKVQSIPLFFSTNNGIVSITPSSLNQSSFLLNESIADETVDLSSITVLGTDNASLSDTCSRLQAAFLHFYRTSIAQAQSLLEELFPTGDSAGLDAAVVQLSTQLLDDIPATDPRWAEVSESTARTSNASSTTSLITVNQIRDKITAHSYFISFLQKTGLWQRLGISLVGERQIHVRILLAEHSEYLNVASNLRSQHTEHQALIDSAIQFVLAERKESPSGQLGNSDIFYRKISKIDSIVWGLTESQEEVLSADVSPRDASLTIYNVNSVLLSLLKNARETKFAAGVTSRSIANETQIEYIPWVSSEGPRGLRKLLTSQHQMTVEIGLSRAEDGTVRGRLYNQLVELTDEILSGFQPHLSSLASTSHPRHQTLLDEYQRLRYSLLQPLVKGEQFNQAVSLAEKFCDFRTLVEVCDKTDNQERLNQYMTEFGSQGFSDFVFRWYLETGRRGKLLTHGSVETTKKELARFLQDYSSLAWLHQINSRDFEAAHKTLKQLALEENSYLSRKKTLLSLSKLCGLAAGPPRDADEEIDQQILVEEDLILYQEQVPEVVLTAHSISPDNMRVFSPKELIHLYIGDENISSNEFDFKKALDLLSWIDDPEEEKELQRLIWISAILRNDWTQLDTDNPVQSLSDTLFFRTVELAFTQGCDVKELLTPVEDLLQSEELGDLSENSSFQFLLKAGYEKINEISS